jgi:hypothetical protein
MIIRHRAGIVGEKKELHTDFLLPRIEDMRAFRKTADERNTLLSDPDLFVVVLPGVTMADVRRKLPLQCVFFLGFCPFALKPAPAHPR